VGECDPKGSIQRRQPGPALAPSVDLELLAQRELDEGLIMATPEERKEAPEDRERESRCGPHRGPILLESIARVETESDSALRLPFEDEQ